MLWNQNTLDLKTIHQPATIQIQMLTISSVFIIQPPSIQCKGGFHKMFLPLLSGAHEVCAVWVKVCCGKYIQHQTRHKVKDFNLTVRILELAFFNFFFNFSLACMNIISFRFHFQIYAHCHCMRVPTVSKDFVGYSISGILWIWPRKSWASILCSCLQRPSLIYVPCARTMPLLIHWARH